MIGCSTDERMPSLNDTPTCSEALQHFIIYPLSY